MVAKINLYQISTTMVVLRKILMGLEPARILNLEPILTPESISRIEDDDNRDEDDAIDDDAHTF